MHDLTAAASLTQRFQDTDFALKQGDVMVLSLPEFPYSAANLRQRPAGDERRLPVQPPDELRIDYSTEVELPHGARVLALPAPETIENSVGTFSTEMTYNKTKRTIIYLQRIETNTDYIEPENYPAYKNGVDRVTMPASRLALLEMQ